MTFNPIQSIDKTRVAKRFAHAHANYIWARMQRTTAGSGEDASPADGAPEALRRTKQYRQTFSCPESISPFRKVAEFGWGTGCYSRFNAAHPCNPESLLPQ